MIGLTGVGMAAGGDFGHATTGSVHGQDTAILGPQLAAEHQVEDVGSNEPVPTDIGNDGVEIGMNAGNVEAIDNVRHSPTRRLRIDL
jgi:hypothetical protein